jgi:hypothetical protein
MTSSLRMQRSNPESRGDRWIASSFSRGAMTLARIAA